MLKYRVIELRLTYTVYAHGTALAITWDEMGKRSARFPASLRFKKSVREPPKLKTLLCRARRSHHAALYAVQRNNVYIRPCKLLPRKAGNENGTSLQVTGDCGL